MLVDALQRDQDSGSVMTLALNSVNLVLGKSEKCKLAFSNLGGQQILEDLQISPYHEVYKLSSEILCRHFDG